MSLAWPDDARSQGPNQAASRGLDFSFHMRRLCQDMVDRLDAFEHIDLARVAIGFCQARKNTRHGLYATLTPMRFAGGKEHTVRHGRRWGVQRLTDASGQEMLYILNFYLPRFFQQSLEDKLATVTHELWHISPRFNGDIRRHGGRYFAHGSGGDHDEVALRLARRWLALGPPSVVFDFLRHDFAGLHARYGGVFGRKIPSPKLYPVE
ncbi:MAG: hypothetical protein JW818_02220 [Pirellulales bacterium]|nr:hypothetical protein [Pirellulales bacterium]